VPVTITEITLEPNASIDQEIPSSYNGFVFTLRGSIQVGATSLKTGQTGWLDRPKVDGASLLGVTAGEEGARLVFYAGQPQGDPIVSYGPFIGDSKQDIVRLYTELQSGQFVSLSELVKAAV
jgi:redox-sensitive bicupin YhaK (pirin superfamily)